jgi:peptide/nickel transport system substrate-binding protein
VSKKSRARAAAAGAATLVTAVALTACGSSSPSSSTGASSTGAATPTKTLTIIGGFGTTLQSDFNPFAMATNSATGGTNLLYLPLAVYNPLNGKYTQYLASSENVVSAKEVDFTLRSGVKWTDGKPVTAADVEFSFGVLKKYPALDTTGIGQLVQSITASGDKLVFTLKAPDSQAAPQLAQIPVVPAAEWSAVSNPSTYVNAAPTVVDGPYDIQNASSVKIVLQKNPQYFGIAQLSQAPDTVTALPQLPGATQVLDMEKGIFDWNETNDSDRGGFATDFVAKDPAHNKYWIPAGGLQTLYMNLSKAPFNDLKFRQALNYGINRAAVSQHANVNGYETPVAQTGLLPNQQSLLPASVPNGGNVSYDPAKAKQLLLSDGYHYSGSTLIGKDGKPVTFTLQTIQGFVDWLGDATEVAAELGQLGMTVTVTQVQFSTGISNVMSGQYDMALYFGSMSATPYANYQSMLASYLSAPVGQISGGDFEHLNSPQADALLGQIAASTSTAAQNAAIGSLASLVYNTVPVIELHIYPAWYEYTTKNYTGWPDAANPYADPVSLWAPLNVITQLKAA